MSQYRDGSASVTNGSAVVAISGASLLENAAPGDLFTLKGSGVLYEIAAVDDDGQISLTAPYAGDTASGQDYVIVTGFTPNFGIPEVDGGDYDWPKIMKQALRKIDAVIQNHEERLQTHGL